MPTENSETRKRSAADRAALRARLEARLAEDKPVLDRLADHDRDAPGPSGLRLGASQPTTVVD